MGRVRRRHDAPVAPRAAAARGFSPLTGAPGMFTMNGVGTRLYGKSEYDGNDGTYIGTLCFVVLFVPLYPLASYLVRSAPTGGGWSFFAKVPVSRAARLWQHAVALGFVALALVAGVDALRAYRHNTIHVVNALPVDVIVTLSDGATTRVPATHDATLSASAGETTLRVVRGGQEIESEVIRVPGGRATVVWNVLGAAAVYRQAVTYASSTAHADHGEKREPEVFCGQRLIVREGIDFAFTPPPQQLSGSGNGVTVRSAMGYAQGGLTPCAMHLMSIGREDDARRLVFAAARAAKANAKALGDVLQALLAGATPEEADAFTRELVAWDDSVDAHRARQEALLESGQQARAITEYEARRAATPASGDAAYLAARVLPRADELPRLDALVAEFPNHALLRRAHAMSHGARQDYASAVTSYEALARIDPAMGAEMLALRVEALVGLGRGKDALTLLGSLSKDLVSEASVDELELRVHRALDPAFDPPARGTLSPTVGDRPLFHRAAAGLPISDAALAQVEASDQRDALRIAIDARATPESALARADKASSMALFAVPPVINALLLGEAVLEGREALVAKLGRALFMSKRGLAAATTFLRTGVMEDTLIDLPCDVRGALGVARSHRVDIAPQERADLRAKARALDVLRGPVTVAADGWVP